RPHLTLRKRPPARGGAAMTIPPAHLDVLRQMRHVASPVSNAQAEDARRQRISARIVELQRQPIVAERHPTRWHLALGAGVAVAAPAVLWLTDDTPAPEPATSSEFAQVVEGRLQAGSPASASMPSPSQIAFDPARELLVVASTEVRMPSRATLKLTS